MGGVPKQHKTSSKVRSRRANLALKRRKLNACPSCGGPVLSHRACSQCGNYSKKK